MSAITQLKTLIKTYRSELKINEISKDNPLHCEIPLADVHENMLQAYENKDWRSHFTKQLNGKGLEIGPLHRPMVKHAGMQIDYIDRCTVAELRAHYPELNNLPLVEPNIIGNAETLENIADGQYDFVISAHVIEHMKNPIHALKCWLRVCRKGGKIYLIVPDKRATFDKKRVRTTLSHIILDYKQPSNERDFEHYLDYAIHVHNKDEDEAIIEAQHLIDTDYSIHFHVFMPSDIVKLLHWFAENVTKIRLLKGPVMAPHSDEFHFLLERI